MKNISLKNQLFKWFFIAILVPIFGSSVANGHSCRDIFAKPINRLQLGLSEKGIQKQINYAFRQMPIKDRLMISPSFKFRLFRPFSVREVREFFPEGRMPELNSLNTVQFIRASRREGLREIRRATEFSEERAWIYVPKLEIWIYDSVAFSGERTVGTNGILHDVLTTAFGGIDVVHTHPRIAGESIRAESERFKKYPLDVFLLTNALPSVQDIMMLLRSVDLSKEESLTKQTGKIVHPLGVTSFRVRAFPYTESDGSRTGIYPGLTTWKFVDVLSENLKPSEKVYKMLELAEQASTDVVTFEGSQLKWTHENSPRLLLSFTSWADL